MKSPVIIGLGVAAVVVVGGVIYSSYYKSGSPYGTTNMNMPTTSSSPSSSSSAPAAGASAVTIAGFAFSPANITVKVGTKVTWTNTDSVSHNVISDSSNGPKSGTLGKGDSYSFTFDKAGTYTYICSFHPYMKGSVTVTQ